MPFQHINTFANPPALLDGAITSGATGLTVQDLPPGISTAGDPFPIFVVAPDGISRAELMLVTPPLTGASNETFPITRAYGNGNPNGATVHHHGDYIYLPIVKEQLDDLTNQTLAHNHSNSTLGGSTLSPAVFTIPGSSSPAQTADGQAVWNSTSKVLTIGNGAARVTLVNSTGVVTQLSALTDVSATAPVHNDFLRYSTADSKWHNATFSAVTQLSALTDVSATAPGHTHLLQYSSADSKWHSVQPENIGRYYIVMDATSTSPVPVLTPDGTDYTYAFTRP